MEIMTSRVPGLCVQCRRQASRRLGPVRAGPASHAWGGTNLTIYVGGPHGLSHLRCYHASGLKQSPRSVGMTRLAVRGDCFKQFSFPARGRKDGKRRRQRRRRRPTGRGEGRRGDKTGEGRALFGVHACFQALLGETSRSHHINLRPGRSEGSLRRRPPTTTCVLRLVNRKTCLALHMRGRYSANRNTMKK